MKRMMLISALLAAVLPLGCASSHNLKTDGHNPFGGGFAENELRPGLYQLTARSNVAPWPSFGAAKSTWKARADKLCGEDNYDEIGVSGIAGPNGTTTSHVPIARHMVAVTLPHFNAALSGYILCKNAGVTVLDAMLFLRDREVAALKEVENANQIELERLGGPNCGDTEPKAPSETYFRKGRALMGLNRYGEAMTCLLRAQADESDPEVHRESCSLIATMYELGWGVEPDLEAAKTWLRRGGL